LDSKQDMGPQEELLEVDLNKEDGCFYETTTMPKKDLGLFGA
jgi:hypothetical protein